MPTSEEEISLIRDNLLTLRKESNLLELEKLQTIKEFADCWATGSGGWFKEFQ